jgi:hypothetical protein
MQPISRSLSSCHIARYSGDSLFITTFTWGGGEPSVSRTRDISGRIYLFFGMDDASIPLAHIAEIDAALT